jgi:hypothetical protein
MATKKSRKLIEYDGKKLTATGWSRETGIADATILERLNNGWSVESALTTAPDSVTNRPEGVGRTLKDGIVSSYLEVWKQCGRIEFEKQLAEAFQSDALKTVERFGSFLPKEALEKATLTKEKAVIKIELHNPATASVTDVAIVEDN